MAENHHIFFGRKREAAILPAETDNG